MIAARTAPRSQFDRAASPAKHALLRRSRREGTPRENYTLTENRGVVTLSVDMDTAEEHQKFFEETWPKALATLKDLSEHRAAVRV
jgi:hypothetical protein